MADPFPCVDAHLPAAVDPAGARRDHLARPVRACVNAATFGTVGIRLCRHPA
jgi:hypothetical protein